MQKLCALVPMKGHSERVPNKNLKLFRGKPLCFAILQTLEESTHVEKIIINTDSEAIADEVQKNFTKAVIHWRPVDIQGDFVSMNMIIENDLEQSDFTHYVQTHSTNPLLTVETLDQAIEAYFLQLKDCDSLFSVTRHQARFYYQDGRPINHNPDELLRTQDLPPLFEENSNFYIFNRESFFGNNKKRIGKKPQLFEVNKLEGIDIDEHEDFVLAEKLYKRQENLK